MTEPNAASNEEYALGELLGSALTSDLFLGQYGEGGVTVLLKRFHIPDVDQARLNRLRWQMLWIGATRYPGVAWMRALLQDEEGRPILVLQRAGEETLEQFLRRNDWGLATSAALDLVRRLAIALKQAVELGLDYTFVQPPTIMLEGGAKPILLGFDLASDLDVTAVAADAPPEQVALLAPEQRSGRGSDERSLVYSLGALLSRLIAPAWLVGQREDRVSAKTEALLQTAMAEDPQTRYPDLGAFLEALDTAIAGEDPLASAEKAAAVLPATGAGWKPSGTPSGTRTPMESRLFAVPRQPAVAAQAASATGELEPAPRAAPASTTRARRRSPRLPLLLLYLLLGLIAAGAILLMLEPDLLASLRSGEMVEDGALPPTPTLFNLGVATTPVATNTPEPPRVEAIRSTATASPTLIPQTVTATRPSPTPSPTRPAATATATSSPSPSATIVPPSPTAVIVLPPAPTVPPAPPPTNPPPPTEAPPPPPPTEPPPPPPTEPPPPPTEPPVTPTAPVP